jgi:hypothetical protein
MRDLTITRFALNPAACDGHTFRHYIEGGGLMQLYLGGVCDRVRAQKWDVDDGVNWEALNTLSNRIQYHVRKRLAVGKAPGMPVLSQALEMARVGYALKSSAQTPWEFKLQPTNK